MTYRVCVIAKRGLLRWAICDLVKERVSGVDVKVVDAVDDMDRTEPRSVDLVILESLVVHDDPRAIAGLMGREAPPKVVVMGDQGDWKLMSAVVARGAHAVLTRHSELEVITETVRLVRAGQVLIDPLSLATSLARMLMTADPSVPEKDLVHQILAEAARGETFWTIAQELGLGAQQIGDDGVTTLQQLNKETMSRFARLAMRHGSFD